MRGSTPATAEPTILTNGFNLYSLIALLDAINNAAAPSFNPDELPAVTEPSFLKAGLKLPKISIVVFGRINSSFSKRIGSPFF